MGSVIVILITVFMGLFFTLAVVNFYGDDEKIVTIGTEISVYGGRDSHFLGIIVIRKII